MRESAKNVNASSICNFLDTKASGMVRLVLQRVSESLGRMRLMVAFVLFTREKTARERASSRENMCYDRSIFSLDQSTSRN